MRPQLYDIYLAPAAPVTSGTGRRCLTYRFVITELALVTCRAASPEADYTRTVRAFLPPGYNDTANRERHYPGLYTKSSQRQSADDAPTKLRGIALLQ